MSSTWNSAMLRSMSTTRVPRPTPRALSPPAAAATRWAYSLKVHSPQESSSFRHRSATWSPSSPEVFTNMDGIVWPSTTAWISALVAIAGSPSVAWRRTAHPRT